MKKLMVFGILALLMFSIFLVGCSDNNNKVNVDEEINTSNPTALTNEQAVIGDIDQELLSENDVEIGDVV